MEWRKKITKRQLTHVREHCGGTLRGLKKARELQKKIRADVMEVAPQLAAEPCFDCWEVARRLGLD